MSLRTKKVRVGFILSVKAVWAGPRGRRGPVRTSRSHWSLCLSVVQQREREHLRGGEGLGVVDGLKHIRAQRCFSPKDLLVKFIVKQLTVAMVIQGGC